ncbi:Endoplasmin-like protein, partial [Mucuna pruriens]
MTTIILKGKKVTIVGADKAPSRGTAFVESKFTFVIHKTETPSFQANAEVDFDDEFVDPLKVEDKTEVVPHGPSLDSDVIKRESISRRPFRSNVEKFEF